MSSRIFLFIAIVFVILRYLELAVPTKNKITGTIKAKWTLKLLFLTSNLMVVSSLVEFFIHTKTLFPSVSFLASLAYLSQVWLRLSARKALGTLWSTHVEIRDQHPLIRKGPYRWLRHPVYLAILIESFSYPLILNAYYTLLISIFMCVPAIFARLISEDREMLKKCGEEYKIYIKETWALVPFGNKAQLIRKLKKLPISPKIIAKIANW